VSNIPDDLRYTNEHEYVRRIDGGLVEIGITDYAQGELGDIVFVTLPAAGDTFEPHGSFGSIEAVKAVSELFSPVGGEVAEVNDALDADPGVINRDPFGAGWMIRLKPADDAQIDALMDAAAYRAHIGE
jgi:glycine cleavage system H protein